MKIKVSDNKQKVTTDKNSNIRIRAAYALGEIKDRRAISFLLKALYDKNMKVRTEACNSLGYYKDKTVLMRLLNIVKNDKLRYVRTAALYALKRHRDKSSVLSLFDRYSTEKDPIIKEKLREFIREYIKSRYIHILSLARRSLLPVAFPSTSS